MKSIEIDYNDVGTFPKFAHAVIKILLEMLKWMMTKQPPAMKVRGRAIFQPIHVMALFGFSVRKFQRIRSSGLMEYMISKDGQTIFIYEEQVQDYIDRNFISSRSPEANISKEKRNKKITAGAKTGPGINHNNFYGTRPEPRRGADCPE